MSALILFHESGLAQTLSQSGQLQEAIHLMEDKGDYPAAIKLLDEVVKGAERNLAARGLLYVALCYERLGKEIARQKYQRLIDEFSDQKALVDEAKKRLAGLSATTSAPIIRQILADAGVMTFGAPSKGRRYLCYVDWGSYNLNLLDLVTLEKRRLTDNPDPPRQMAEYSLVSPDGTQIAYAWVGLDEVLELRLCNLDGTNPRPICRMSSEREYLKPTDWSLDGQFLLVCVWRRDRVSQIVRITVADGSMLVLKTFERETPRGIFFSPDGRFCVYDFPQREDSRDRDIYIIPTDQSEVAPVPLVEHIANDTALGWAPDGGRLLFASDRSSTRDAWLIEVQGGQPRRAPKRIYQDIGRVSPLMMTAKGALYYERTVDSMDLFFATLDPTTGKPVGNPVPATQRYVGSNRCGAWSPDGKSLAYYCDHGQSFAQKRTLIIRSLETGAEHEWSPKLNWMNHIRLSWSPDSRRILITGNDAEDHWGIFEVDAQSGELSPICRAPSNVMNAMWSNDGQAIYHNGADTATKPWTSRVVRRDRATGHETDLYRGAPHDLVKYFDVSPDGDTLALLAYEEGSDTLGHNASVIRLLPAAGGETRKLYRTENPIWMDTVAWSADGKYVLFTKANVSETSPSKPELCRVSIETGVTESLGLGMGGMAHLRCHPDGRRIVFNKGEGSSELWVMEISCRAKKASELQKSSWRPRTNPDPPRNQMAERELRTTSSAQLLLRNTTGDGQRICSSSSLHSTLVRSALLGGGQPAVTNEEAPQSRIVQRERRQPRSNPHQGILKCRQQLDLCGIGRPLLPHPERSASPA